MTIDNLQEKEYLLITNEHGAAKHSGGIGSYVEELEHIAGYKLAVLFCGRGVFDADEKVKKERNWITLEHFYDEETINLTAIPILIAHIVEHLCKEMPKLKSIEFQEHIGVGALLGRYKRNKLIPAHVLLITHCHGGINYLEVLNQNVFSIEASNQAYLDKVSIEHSDIVRFPSLYLFNLYKELGINFENNKIINLRLPFNYQNNYFNDYFKSIDTIIFFGKKNKMKGFDYFKQAIIKLINDKSYNDSIKNIILLGPKYNRKEEEEFMATLSGKIKVENISLSRIEALALIKKNASHALCILPYRGDNHPVSVLEVVNSECSILAANAGGIPEMIPESFHKKVLSQLNTDDLASAILNYIAMPADKRRLLAKELLMAMKEEQDIINNNQFTFIDTESIIEIEKNKTEGLIEKSNVIVSEISDINFDIQNIEKADVYIFNITKELSEKNIDLIRNYFQNNSTMEAAVISNKPELNQSYPFLIADGLSSFLTKENFILSNILAIRKELLFDIIANKPLISDNDKHLDMFWLYTQIKKKEKKVGLVYIQKINPSEIDFVIQENLFQYSEIICQSGLNKFDFRRSLTINLAMLKKLNTKVEIPISSLIKQLKYKIVRKLKLK